MALAGYRDNLLWCIRAQIKDCGAELLGNNLRVQSGFLKPNLKQQLKKGVGGAGAQGWGKLSDNCHGHYPRGFGPVF